MYVEKNKFKSPSPPKKETIWKAKYQKEKYHGTQETNTNINTKKETMLG